MTGQLREIGPFPWNRMASNLLRVKIKFVSLTELTAFCFLGRGSSAMLGGVFQK